MEPYVALTLAAALLFAVGNALQKHGIDRRTGPLPAGSLARPLRLLGALLGNPVWLLGGAVTLAAVGLETSRCRCWSSARGSRSGFGPSTPWRSPRVPCSAWATR